MIRLLFTAVLLAAAPVLIADTPRAFVQQMVLSGAVYEAMDSDIGVILDPEEHASLYESIEGFFSHDRSAYVDPSLRQVLSAVPCMQEEIVHLRIGAVSNSRTIREYPVKLFTFSGRRIVTSVVVRTSAEAPRGFYILDGGNVLSE